MKLGALLRVLCVTRYDLVEVDNSGEILNRYKFRYVGGIPHGLEELKARARLSTAKVLEVGTYDNEVLEITVRTPA